MFGFLEKKTNHLEEFRKNRKKETEEIWTKLMYNKKQEEEKITAERKASERIDNKVDELIEKKACLDEKIDGLVEDKNTSYKDVVFDEKAKYQDNDSSTKELLTYDKSLERIKQKNPSARHARPSEAFGLIIDCLENKVSDKKLLKVKKDMLKSYGEWLSCAFERQNNTLIVYLDPTGINWNGSEYNKTENFKFSDKKEFNITGINSQRWTDLNTFSDEFVKYIYGRKFSELPQKMKEGNKRAQVYLPQEGKIWPVGRGNFVGYYVVFVCIGWASRGVAVVGAPR